MSPKPLIDVRPDHWEIVQNILQKHVSDREVWAFGSRAKWSAKAYSDLDLAVIGERPLSVSVSAALEDDFRESGLPWKVDVVDWATTTPAFQSVIERDKVILQARRTYTLPDWPKVRIEKIAEKISIGPFGSRMKSETYVSCGVPVIRGTNLTGGRRFSGEWVYVSEEKANELASCNTVAGDLVFPHRGAIGEVGLVPADRERYMLSSSLMMLRCNKTLADSLYLFYFFKSATGQHELLKNASQVGTPGIGQPLSSLKSIELALPPLKEQRAIAQTLGALDDKIELNRQMNATLGAMSRALFQSWFVDFDPVRSKLEGRLPTDIDEATAAFFPGAFQGSELGKIPYGWEIGSILRQADLLSGGTPKTDVLSYWNGDVPWASAKDISQCSGAFLRSTERTITELGVKESSTKVIPEFATVVVARGATTGRLTMLGRSMAMNQTCYGLHSKFGAPFSLYCHIDHFIERLVKGGHGSIFDTITTSTFEATDVLIAPEELLLAFDKRVAAFFEEVLVNLHQSQTLATLRDTLLPKLLSGELRVRDAEAIVKDQTA